MRRRGPRKVSNGIGFRLYTCRFLATWFSTSASVASDTITTVVASSSGSITISPDPFKGRSIKTGDINGLGAIILQGDQELDNLTFLKSAKAFRFDRRLMNEEIFTAVVGADKTVAFLIVEPPHGSSGSSVVFRH
ncbi:hypothetical protein U1Q18_038939 [Sarracenia purpurea var. burkii]